MQQLQDSVSKYVAAIDQQVMGGWCCTLHDLPVRGRTTTNMCSQLLQVERVEVENLRAVGLRNKMAAMHEVGGLLQAHRCANLQANMGNQQVLVGGPWQFLMS